MTMPTFEPVAFFPQNVSLGIQANVNQPRGAKLFTEAQLQQAYEAGKRDAAPEWISVDDQLPKVVLHKDTDGTDLETGVSERVLVLWSHGRVDFDMVIKNDYGQLLWNGKDGWNRVSMPGGEYSKIAHWLPLPTILKRR